MKDAEGKNNTGVSSPSIGELLRQARQKRGLDYQQLFEVTRLRPSIIKALESEAWEELPSPVFVKGFIRSYAQAVGIDVSEALATYERQAPKVSSEPEPLVKAKKKRFPWGVLLVVGLAVVVLGFFFWEDSEFPQPSKSEKVQESSVVEPPELEKKVSGEDNLEGEAEKKETEPQQTALPSQTGKTEALESMENSEESEMKERETVATAPEEQKPEVVQASEAPAERAGSFILQGNVLERTWMRIIIDGQEPKEYIFNPGSRPQWKAEKGFDIMIGNAAGIELRFNGTDLGPLGDRGKVVRLKLPKE